jgi:hypothetical protein
LLHFLVRLACVRHAASVDSEPGSNSRLKPDVCRRVVGRLPSPGFPEQRLHAAPDNDSGWRHRSALCVSTSFEAAKKKFTVVYLVRSLGLMPEFVSHDWHVQPSCQRPNRGPPRRREFSPGEFFFVSKPTSANPTVLETLQTYSAAENPVNHRNPQDFQMISTSGRVHVREQES